ncbi:hypothetical protein TELCIR_20240 [Teladorsagia circumcincta]|uniref:Helicase ATP-binding domain-containing protein n=1 Tax=Teladorsagia circumcincta TaxID=45464 RepID=A0A2G9TK20_TELCI|nr:hypothetical protein TELCIR_20240 [Teladorsagia circumcincta]
MNSALYDTILRYLATVDVDLHSTLCCVSEKDSRSQFSKVLLKLDEFWTHLDVEKTLEFLKGIQYYNTVTSRIEKSLEDLPSISFGNETLTGRLLKAIDDRSFAETPILLRDYQKELCEKAMGGMNTIIAAPTGSGKTVVAVNIIKSHLDRNRISGRMAKVLFMTPNTVILDQQADCLRKFLGHRYQVDFN